MKTANNHFSRTASRVKLYRSQFNEYNYKNRDHQEAMACLDFEQILSFGIGLFDQLIAFDESVRLEVFSEDQPEPKSLEILADIKRIMDWWLAPCDKVEEQIRAFEKSGYTVEGAADFRERHSEAKWILGDASSVCSSVQLENLRDEAVDGLRGEADNDVLEGQ